MLGLAAYSDAAAKYVIFLLLYKTRLRKTYSDYADKQLCKVGMVMY